MSGHPPPEAHVSIGTAVTPRCINCTTIKVDTAAALAFGVPPCGTEEAKHWRACIAWRLIPCPGWGQGTDGNWRWTNAPQPIGCPTEGLVGSDGKPLPPPVRP